MMNYNKSELYRIFITKEIYTAAGLLAGIALLLNVALYFFGNSSPRPARSIIYEVSLPVSSPGYYANTPSPIARNRQKPTRPRYT